MDINKAIQLLAMLVSMMPELLKFPGLIAQFAQSFKMTEAELRSRLAAQEAGIPEMISYWEGYQAQRNPGDTGA